MQYSTLMKEFDLRKKSDPKWTHLPVFWFMSLFCTVTKDWSFYETHANTLGDCLYVPDKSYNGYASADPLYEQVFRHEYCHVLQYKTGKIKYLLGYLLSSKQRMLLEIEAYCHQLACSKNYKGGLAQDWAKEVVTKAFSSSSPYFFWLPRKLSLKAPDDWDDLNRSLVREAVNICRDEYTVKYLRDYGRLPRVDLRRLENQIDRILKAL